jgi:hypothetical protein
MGRSYFNDSVTVSTWDERDVVLEEGCGDNPGLLLVMQVSFEAFSRELIIMDFNSKEIAQIISTKGMCC